MRENALEKTFGILLARSPQFAQNLLLKFVYWIIEEVDGFLPQTTSARMAAGSAIATSEMLDIEQALKDGEQLPDSIANVLATFTNTEWREVLLLARSDRSTIAAVLKDPQWTHLRKTSS